MTGSLEDTQQRLLKQWFGISDFWPDQLVVINGLLAGQRMLFIAPTGYGKSLCYQFTARFLHESNKGLTIVFSPLLTLIRDQIDKLSTLGIKAISINSTTGAEEFETYLNLIRQRAVVLLYMAPEQIDGAKYQQVMEAIGGAINLVVIDEAHCISVWGHDFRLHYTRIHKLLAVLPNRMPVLACTATATPEVAKDIEAQLITSPSVHRLKLVRPNIRLGIAKADGQANKAALLIAFLRSHPDKKGIVYCGTRTQAEIIASYLTELRINAICYHAGLGDARVNIEQDWKQNKYRVVVATNALGMGVDKIDIDFVVHFQVPQSLIHYYQEFGRCGRGNQEAYALMLLADEDWRLPTKFAERCKPTVEFYLNVLNALKQSPASSIDLIRKFNVKKTQVDIVLNDLAEQAIVNKTGTKYEVRFNAPDIDFKLIDAVRITKVAQVEAIRNYTNLDSGYATHIANYLGDQVSHSTATDLDVRPYLSAVDDVLKESFNVFLDNFHPELELTGAKLLQPAFAISHYGDSNMGLAIGRAKQSGADFDDWVLKKLLNLYHKQYKQHRFTAVSFVPPTKSGPLVERLVNKFAKLVNLPVWPLVDKTRQTHEQKAMLSAYTKKDNLKDAFALKTGYQLAGHRLLLIDDVWDSGATIKTIGKLLDQSELQQWSALVLAKTAVSDN